jgi:hypothetical protein
MVSMSMSAEAARRALEDAKGDDDFVRRYLDGDKAAFRHMQGLLQAAYPDDGSIEAGSATRDDAGLAGPEPAGRAPAMPSGDGGGSALSDWLLEAGDAGFAPPKSPAHYQLDYAPNVEIDPDFDGMARDWMYKAELPAGWAGEIARDYQRRAAKPPSADEVAQEREAVLGRLRKDWGDAADAKLAQERGLIGGIGDDRLSETLDRSGLGNNEWLIRQLAILADRKAATAAARVEGDKHDEGKGIGETNVPSRGIAYRTGEAAKGDDADGFGDKQSPFIRLGDKSDKGTQIAEDTPDGRQKATQSMPSGEAPLPNKGRSYPNISLEGGYVPPPHIDPRMPEKLAVPRLNFGQDRHQSIIADTPSHFDIAENAGANGSKPSHASHMVGRDAVVKYSKLIEEEARAQGVDANLVKAIMYVENAQGWYGIPLEAIGIAGSLFPMNIKPDVWKGLGFTKEDFKNPRMNIRAGITLLKRIIARVENPTVAKVASLYNNLRTEHVTDYGARVAEVYTNHPWPYDDWPWRQKEPSQ